MAERDRDWLYDFSFVLTPEIIDRYIERDPSYEAFLGSKLLPFPWLVLVAALAGALGGALVSAALWEHWWQILPWLAVTAAFGIAAHRLTRRLFGSPITFLAGWCLFFGSLIGAFAMWGAQLSSSAWAYGIAGVAVFFLLGITGGLIEPPNSKPSEDWFLTGAIAAPLSSCLAVWTHRNLLADPATLPAAAFTGALAALPFLAVVMALHLKAWNPNRGVLHLATLCLHNDRFVGRALELLDRVAKALPGDARVFERRGLAHALAGDSAKADAEWARARELDADGVGPALCRGWAELRGGRLQEAQLAFEDVLARRKRDPLALQGLGIARLRQDDASGAVQALNRVRTGEHGALSLTYLAEAWLAYGDAANAIGAASAAIDEADSTHGRSWLVRADAYRAQGRIESAAEDYNRAIWAADEPGIKETAVAGLEAIDRPISEDEPE